MWSSISVVIPVYNSVNSLEELTERLIDILSGICSCYEIILVDDGSKDASYNKMLELHGRNQGIKLIRLDGNYGQQNALICGFKYAEGDFIITLDDDLQYLPEDIKKLMLTIDKGYDLVYGISTDRNYSLIRKLGSRLRNYLFNIITDKPENINLSSFRVFRSELLKKILSHQESFVYISVIILKYTTNIANVTVRHNCRKYGSSNYSFIKLVKLFMNIIIYYSDITPLKIFVSSKPQYRIKELRF